MTSQSKIRIRRARGPCRSLLIGVAIAGCALGHAALAAQDEPVSFAGPIAVLTRDRPGDEASNAVIEVGRRRIVVPPDLKVEFPATTMTLTEILAAAPPGCRQRGETGLAKADVCRADPDGLRLTGPEPGGEPAPETELAAARAVVDAAIAPDGHVIASRIRVSLNLEELMGGVTFVNAADGYLRINGHYRADEGGTLVRINDPGGEQSEQHGPECGPAGNCSVDPRFRPNRAEWSVRFEQGNPACVGSVACVAANRAAAVDDHLCLVPIRAGDNVVVHGAFEVVNGVRYFSAQDLLVQTSLSGGR